MSGFPYTDDGLMLGTRQSILVPCDQYPELQWLRTAELLPFTQYLSAQLSRLCDSYFLVTSHADVLVDADIGVTVASQAHVHEGTEIDATAITDGFVLTADGAGNSVWEIVPPAGSEINDLS